MASYTCLFMLWSVPQGEGVSETYSLSHFCKSHLKRKQCQPCARRFSIDLPTSTANSLCRQSVGPSASTAGDSPTPRRAAVAGFEQFDSWLCRSSEADERATQQSLVAACADCSCSSCSHPIRLGSNASAPVTPCAGATSFIGEQCAEGALNAAGTNRRIAAFLLGFLCRRLDCPGYSPFHSEVGRFDEAD